MAGLLANGLAPGPAAATTAARIGLGVATGGTSEIIANVLNLIPSIFQGIAGAKQLKDAKQIEKENPRPDAVVAPSIDKLTGYAYGKTFDQDIPGGELYRNEIKGATAAGIKAASELGSGSEAYGMLGQLVDREQNSLAQLAGMTAERVAGKEDAYMNTLLSKADEENRVWEWNKAQPYLMAAQAAQSLRDSGLKNINSGLKNVFGSAAEAVSPDFSSSLLWGNDGTRGGGISAAELKTLLSSLK